MAESRVAPSLRVLCLHDGHSSAAVFHQKLHVLDQRLYEKHGIELVYVNSPLRGGSTDQGQLQQDDGYIWWDTSQDNESQTYLGLDATLLHLRQIWNTLPFCGVLGVGQGAAVASLLPLLQQYPELAFGIFWNGQAILCEDESLIEDFSCLHVIDSPCEGSDKLVRQFGGTVHRGSGQTTKASLNAMGKFLVEQKKRLWFTGDQVSPERRLVLQNQLYRAEQEASRFVAEKVAENPPKALMAVISPQLGAVGAWSGPKRREPNEQGGGAPCPSEFLLKREQRGSRARDDGPSRDHPDHDCDDADGGTGQVARDR